MRSNCIIVYGTKKRLEKLSDHLNKKEATKWKIIWINIMN
jgi:hypothetical protein